VKTSILNKRPFWKKCVFRKIFQDIFVQKSFNPTLGLNPPLFQSWCGN